MIVTFLDSMKAFDTVSHNGLKVKLSELGINGKLWKLLDNMYFDLKSCIRCNNDVSRYFRLDRGVRQGSALSAKLYLIYINELINIISNSGKGAVLVDLNVCCPVQADDIALVTSNEHNMQTLINMCVNYSQRWKFQFSPTKSQAMSFSKRKLSHNLRLDGRTIPSCETLKHVGIVLEHGFNSTERTISACRSIKSTSMSIIKQGIHPSVLNPVVCSKIILQLCYTKALYGCELWNNLTNNEKLLLERAHRYVCKYVQGLPKLTRSDKCTTLLGWTTIVGYIDTKKLLFVGRIINMPSKLLPRQVFLTRLMLFYNKCTVTSGGFIPDIIQILKKYDLFKFIDSFVKSSQFPSQRHWKLLVKSSVHAKEEHSIMERFNIDSDFDYFKVIHKSVIPHRAWTIAKEHEHLRSQCQFVVSLCSLVRPHEPKLLCHKCGSFYSDPIIHIISNCSSVYRIRDELWCEFINIGPIDFSAMLHQMDDINLALTVLSCDSESFYNLSKHDAELFSIACVSYVYKICKAFDV